VGWASRPNNRISSVLDGEMAVLLEEFLAGGAGDGDDAWMLQPALD
jgi:hypothetical protein